MTDNHIILTHKDEGSFLGSLAQPYAYKPELRSRITECLEASIRSDNRFFVLEGNTVKAAQSTLSGAMNYMNADHVLLQVKGCGRATQVSGTNGGKMPCGANLTIFGKTSPYYCSKCEPFVSDEQIWEEVISQHGDTGIA